jgi:transposase
MRIAGQAPEVTKGDVVILDNLGSLKGQAARRAPRQAGAYILSLPPYSPDLKPIERLFAKLKHLVRSAEPRTFEATWRKVGQILDSSPNAQTISKTRICFRTKTAGSTPF